MTDFTGDATGTGLTLENYATIAAFTPVQVTTAGSSPAGKAKQVPDLRWQVPATPRPGPTPAPGAPSM